MKRRAALACKSKICWMLTEESDLNSLARLEVPLRFQMTNRCLWPGFLVFPLLYFFFLNVKSVTYLINRIYLFCIRRREDENQVVLEEIQEIPISMSKIGPVDFKGLTPGQQVRSLHKSKAKRIIFIEKY